MSSVWSSNLRLSIFGESHGDVVGIVIDNFPAGVKLDYDFIYSEMNRRRPGQSNTSTQRNESDMPKVISGVFEGVTTGTPICVVIENNDNKSRDYSEIKNVARAGHADFTARMRFNGFNDYRGGGHFSGRMTAPIVFAGALAKCILKEKGIEIAAHVKSIHEIEGDGIADYVKSIHEIEGDGIADYVNGNFEKNDDKKDVDICKKESLVYVNDVCDSKEYILKNKSDLNNAYINAFRECSKREIPVLSDDLVDKFKKRILDAKEDMDSVGGVIECCVIGMDAGIGNPFFGSIESVISSLMFSVPGVKGIEFGSGFGLTQMYGSQANDEFFVDSNNDVMTLSNNNGGINGGISNSMPIEFSVAIKPTPSIYKTQNTINMETKENIKFNIKGRHDPTIILRAVSVIESMTAIAMLDFLL